MKKAVSLTFYLGSILMGIGFQNASASTLSESSVKDSMQKTDTIILSETDVQTVKREVARLDPNTRKKFETLAEEWNQAIDATPMTKFSSSTVTYTRLSQFAKLKAMGKSIIPLVVEKLLQEDQFHFLKLYEALQDNKQLVSFNVKGGEQGRAKRTVRLWLNSLAKD